MFELWSQFPNIAAQLKEVHTLMQERLTMKSGPLQAILDELLATRGKLLRPGLFLLFSNLNTSSSLKANNESEIKIAASLELLYMATLVHDEIIDDSPLRRGKQTVQSKYGKDIAVYTGDLLFTVMFDLVVEAFNGTPYVQRNVKVMRELLIGELDQMTHRYNLNVTVDDYLFNAQHKTAALFQLACEEGAYLAGLNETQIYDASQVGRYMGIAFQIYDDILDYTSSEEVLNKPVLEDLSQGVYTLPLLLARQEHKSLFDPYLLKKDQLTEQEAQEVNRYVLKYEGVKKAQQVAEHYTQKALDHLHQLPDTPTRQGIESIILLLLERKQ
ncbi:farnesyl pyrophosphate synthetase [Dolosicoccus paucivorans]|uniref:Farnesyl pyrophosphate synthetase n=1 Tax=Dolosicoccus paucivorans TaxID=84521 RepID=A0A2N6SLW4_9LACT|nr:polyprenyl synthetase family protein [Dolosicoccus paucivorans]PMB84923.1 farnesyl pyrophosphate synthetase [Dolosicoccus paucivorans]PMC58046.1 farnesyl pyrophosphate synthetase [Dolosicoccus paucivorans]